jgi:hypothetical protein
MVGGTLYAATMEGLLIGDGKSASWKKKTVGLGKDTTRVVQASDGLWVATRRGLWQPRGITATTVAPAR